MAPAALAVAFIVLHAPAISINTGFPPGEFPVAASAVVDRLPPEARLLAPDKYGGYLIYRFQGRRKVFFDGRSDYYGATFLKDYIPLIELRQGWREQIERWGFTHALLPVNYSLVPALRAAGWRELYRDSTAVLLERV